MEVTGQQRYVAYHESGHAVAQRQYCWNLSFVGIARVIGTGFNWQGAAHAEQHPTETAAVIAYAGPLAEGRFAGVTVSDEELIAGRIPAGLSDDGGWMADAETARKFAGSEALVSYLQRARMLIAQPEIWIAISRLADELCNADRLQRTALIDIPCDIRDHLLPGFDSTHDNRHAAYCYLRRKEAFRLIDDSVRATFRGVPRLRGIPRLPPL